MGEYMATWMDDNYYVISKPLIKLKEIVDGLEQPEDGVMDWVEV